MANLGDNVDIEEEYPPLIYSEAKKLDVKELRLQMDKRGLNTKGGKKILLNRIKYFQGRPQRRIAKLAGKKRALKDIKNNDNNNDEPKAKKQKLNENNKNDDQKDTNEVDNMNGNTV